MVRALVVARWRELAGQWIRTLLLLLGATACAAAIFVIPAPPKGLFIRAFFAMFLGVYLGFFTNAPIQPSWLSMGLTGMGGREVARVLPVSAISRRLAALVIATVLASPFLVIVLGTSLLKHRSPRTICVVIGSVVLGYLVNRVGAFVGTRLRFARSLPSAWISRIRPRRDTEVGAAFWTLLPAQLLMMLVMPFFGTAVGVVLYLAIQTPYFWRFTMFMGAMGSLSPMLMHAIKPLATLSVSRRAVARAELGLTPILAGVAILWTVGVALGVARSANLAWHGAHLAITVACLGAIARVVYARVATPSMTWGHYVIPILVGLCANFFTSPIPSFLLDTISVVAFLVAVLLAYTAPNTPLSTSPFRTDLFANLRRSSATPRGK